MDTPLSAAEFRCYAIDRLGKAKRQIAQSVAELPAARAKLEKYIAKNKAKAEEHFKILLSHKENLLDALNDCRLSLLEMELPMEAAAAMKLCAALDAFTVTTPDYSKLCGILTAFLERLPDERDGTTSAAIIGRLMSNVRMGYYPTDLDHIKMMARGVAFPDGVTTNLLDPCCGEGIALRALATGNNCFTYGVEIDEHRAGASRGEWSATPPHEPHPGERLPQSKVKTVNVWLRRSLEGGGTRGRVADPPPVRCAASADALAVSVRSRNCRAPGAD